MVDRFGVWKFAFVVGAVAFCSDLVAQEYSVQPGAAKDPQAQTKQVQPQDQPLGWGSNIENARLARAAQSALQQGNHALAFDYAQRAAQAAPNDPQLWFLLGYAARLDAKFTTSAEAYSKGLRLNPSSLEGMSGLAQTYSLMGRKGDAERLLKQVVASDPRRKDEALLLGDLYIRSGEYTEALEWLSRAERAQPAARSELLLAIAYQHLKQMDQANQYLKLARQRDPNNPDVQRSMAGYYRESGDYSDAITALKSIRSPGPDVVAELANTYQLDGKADDAARLYAQAANVVPRDIDLQLAAAQAAVAAGSKDSAAPFLQRAAGLDSNNYRLHTIRAEIAKSEDHGQDAAQEYRAALTNLPADPAEGPLFRIQLHMNLRDVYTALDDEIGAHRELEEAQTEINALGDHAGDRGPFLRLRARIKMYSGDLDGALGDMKEAIAMNARDSDSRQLDGDILMKLNRPEDAVAEFKQILSARPDSRDALISLGYAFRAAGHDEEAEADFQRLEKVIPSTYVPYLALGDLYTARRDFAKAEVSYSKGYDIAPGAALILAGGMNAAIEAHNLTLAGAWQGRVTDKMKHEPQILREEERYLSFRGQYQESADVGQEAITKLPHDRDVVVYLGYDLLNLKKYDELLSLTTQYLNVLPKEPDIPLLEGYAHKHNGLREEALQDFTEALNRDPEVVTAYVNRGFMANDLRQPQRAESDFEAALKREPDNGEAHLGLAYASLDLNKPETALRQATLAERALGDSRDIHLIRATAYGRQDALLKAADEYRAALKFTPDDGALHFGLGNTLFALRRYHDAIDELRISMKDSPGTAAVYALLARSYGNLQQRDETLRYVQLAEQSAQAATAAANGPASGQSDIYVSTGEALSALGDNAAAMQRFRNALSLTDSDRVGVRLAIAQLMATQGHSEDAQRQIALAQMEAAAGDASPPTGNQYIAAADALRSMHDYQLSLTYLERAKAANAPDSEVRIGMANSYLALGDTARAQAELSAVSAVADSAPDYQYLLAEANVDRQKHHNPQALTAFAQASNAEGEDQTAEEALLQAGADEGLRVTPAVSVLSDTSVEPIFEDSTIYVLDAKLDAAFPVTGSDGSLLPPPRSSIQTQFTGAYHLHLNSVPTVSGLFQLRNAQGQISVPATNSIVNRDTTDYTFNVGLNPSMNIGGNVLTFNTGVQTTVRRDSESPIAMNQNLFRVFTYVTTSSFFNAVAVSGYFVRESGSFTESNLHSQVLAAAIDFRVGAPWGKTALVTGWGSSDQQFSPMNFESYLTASYVGLERRFGERLNVRSVAEDIRAWRIVGAHSGIAQNLRPAGTVDFTPGRNWDLQASSAYSNVRNFHAYDAIQNGFSVSYARPFHRKFHDDSGTVVLQYPIRFSAGMDTENFVNFSGGHNQQFRPYVRISLF